MSPGSLIFGPSDPAWDETTKRWNLFAVPDVQVVVQPAQESDVSKIVSTPEKPCGLRHSADNIV